MGNTAKTAKEKKDKEKKAEQEEAKEQKELQEESAEKEEASSSEKMEEDNQSSPEAEIAELKDKYLRLSAEFDNYRKRTLKERMELTKNAGEEMITSLLPVLDDFERALQSIKETEERDALLEGVELVYNKIKELLMKKGLKEIESMHADFDMEIHEAVTKIPAQDKKMKGKILDVIEKGYYLNDKIIRYPKVVVGE